MSRSGLRSVLAIVVAAVLAAALAACGDSTTPDAAEIDGFHIERADFESELRTLIDNDELRKSLQQESTTDLPADISAGWLGRLIYQSVVDAEFDRRELKLTAADRKAAEQSLLEDYGEAVFGAFPKEFRDTLIARAARFQVLSAAMRGPEPTPADARAYFEENKERYAAECPSNLSVSHILVPDAATADEIVELLENGADFGELARERSQDPGSAAQEGLVGCLVEGQFVPEFEDAAAAATPGVPTAPVKTDFGYHVILTDDDYLTFENLAARVTEELAEAQANPAQAFLLKKIDAADVEVDPRFGTWRRDAEQGGQVVPPTEPSVRDGRAPVTTTVPGAAPIAPGP